MVDIPTIVLDAIKDSDMLEEQLDDISSNLVANIQGQLYPGHGYITGDLHDSIKSDYTQTGLNGLVRAYSQIEYAKWVDKGSPAVEGKLMKMPWGYRMSRKEFGGYNFMETGLEETVAMYK